VAYNLPTRGRLPSDIRHPPPFHVNIPKHRRTNNSTYSPCRTIGIQPQEIHKISRYPSAHFPSPTVTLHPICPLYTTRTAHHTIYPNLEAHIRIYKVSNPSICPPLYSTSIQVYLLTRIEQTQHLIDTCALLIHLNCAYTTHIKDQASEINLMAIPRPDLPSPGLLP
jgi:hypothetical protein